MHGGGSAGGQAAYSPRKTIKMELLLVFDILVTTLKTQSLYFNPPIPRLKYHKCRAGRGGTGKQAELVPRGAMAVCH